MRKVLEFAIEGKKETHYVIMGDIPVIEEIVGKRRLNVGTVQVTQIGKGFPDLGCRWSGAEFTEEEFAEYWICKFLNGAESIEIIDVCKELLQLKANIYEPMRFGTMIVPKFFITSSNGVMELCLATQSGSIFYDNSWSAIMADASTMEVVTDMENFVVEAICQIIEDEEEKVLYKKGDLKNFIVDYELTVRCAGLTA